MKKIILTAFTALFLLTHCFSQDLILKKNGEEIKSKIIEVGTLEIKYKKFENPTGPTYSILKADVFMIKYENGTKDVFNNENPINNSTILTSDDFFNKGKMDAQKYYDGFKGAGTGTLITSLVSPLIGLIPAIACSSTPPKDENLNYPKPDLMKNTEYYNGYTLKAKKIKQGKVWTNWGIAFGVNLVAVILLTAK